MSSPRVKFHFMGHYRARDVVVESAPNRRSRIPEIEAMIEKVWEEARRRPGIKLFDGEMCRLEYFRAGKKLELGLSRTSYKVFWGTNLTHAEFADRYGWESLANAVGLSCALESSDGFLMLGRRNASVAYYPLRVHPFAGALEPADNVDLFADIQRELAEELDFGPSDIAEIACIGMVEDRALRQPEMVFGVKSTRTRQEIELAVAKDEHEGCIAVDAKPRIVEELLRDPSLTPVALGTVLLWGRGQFGAEWFDAAERAVNFGSHESR